MASSASETSGYLRVTLLICALVHACASDSEGLDALSSQGARSAPHVIEGFVNLDEPKLKSTGVRVILNGGKHVTYVRSDGFFSFPAVPEGSYVLEVSALGAYFPPIWLDVSPRIKGRIRASSTEDDQSLEPNPLIIVAARPEKYYEVRPPFSVWSILKSPMGMMVCFMVVAVLILPKLMDSIDPEEMKHLQEQMKNQQAPSFSSLVSSTK